MYLTNDKASSYKIRANGEKLIRASQADLHQHYIAQRVRIAEAQTDLRLSTGNKSDMRLKKRCTHW